MIWDRASRLYDLCVLYVLPGQRDGYRRVGTVPGTIKTKEEKKGGYGQISSSMALYCSKKIFPLSTATAMPSSSSESGSEVSGISRVRLNPSVLFCSVLFYLIIELS